MPYFLAALKICKAVMLLKDTYDFLIICFGRWSIWPYISGKMLLPRYADESILRTKQPRFNSKYILILKLLFLLRKFYNCTINSRQLVQILICRHVIFMVFTRTFFLFWFLFFLEIMQFLGSWHRDTRNVQMWWIYLL